MSQENVFIFGLGAIGSFYAYVLSEAKTRVTVCGRSNYDAVKQNGMNFQSEKFGKHDGYKFAEVVKTPSDPACASVKYSYVVCSHKAVASTPSAPEQIVPVVSAETTIVLIQNGIGNEEEFRARFPNNVICSGVTWVGGTQPSPGVIINRGKDAMQFGCHFSDNIDRVLQVQKQNHFVDLCHTGGTNVDLVPSIELWRWKKTIWNCTWNTLTALTYCNTAEYLGSSSSAKVVAWAIITEMASIARAAGHEIEEEYLTDLIERDQVKQGIYSSMYTDAKNGRPMEVDVIVSGPLRKAKELGVKTPTLETINALVSAINWRVSQPKL